MATSKIIHAVGWILLAATGWASWFWAEAVRTHDGFAALGFTLTITPWLGAAILLLGIIPSLVAYGKSKNRLDKRSLVMSGISMGILLIENVIFFFVPLRGC